MRFRRRGVAFTWADTAASRLGARIIKRHNGEPKLKPPDPNLRSWSAHMVSGKKMTWLGYVEA